MNMNLLNMSVLTLCAVLNNICIKYKGLVEFNTLDSNTIYVKLEKWRGLIHLNTKTFAIIQIENPLGLKDKNKSMSSLEEIIDYAYNFKLDDARVDPNYADIDVVLTQALKSLLKDKVKFSKFAELEPNVYYAYLCTFILQNNLPVSVQLLDDNSIYIFGFTGKDKVRLVIDIKENLVLIPVSNRASIIKPDNLNVRITVINDTAIAGFIESYKELPDSGPDIYYLIANTLKLL